MHRFLIFIILCMPAYAQPLKTTITVDEHVYLDVQRFLAGRNVHEITNFTSPYARRDVVDFVLIQQAIALGGLDVEISFESGIYDARNIRSLVNGLLLIGLDTFWLKDLENVQSSVFISQPLIRKGEYVAGLYTSEHNVVARSAKTLEQIKQLSFVSYSEWTADWFTLKALAPRHLLDEKVWASQAKLVSRGWVDVMLAPFLPDNNFRFSGEGFDIVAIQGVKIMLDDSRHVAVSKKHPYGAETFAALEKGLSLLRAQGRIEQAYIEAGFFNQQVKDWLLINANAPLINN